MQPAGPGARDRRRDAGGHRGPRIASSTRRYPWSRLKEPANVLIFPELQSANIAYKLIWRLADAEAIGPILLGLGKPVHVLQAGMEVSDIVNMAAICVVDAQEAEAYTKSKIRYEGLRLASVDPQHPE